jgi:hypothetical protein
MGDGATEAQQDTAAQLRLKAGMLAVDTENPGKGTPLIEQAVAHFTQVPPAYSDDKVGGQQGNIAPLTRPFPSPGF